MASQTSKILVTFQAEDSQLAAAFKKLGRQSNTLEKNFTSLSDKGIRRIKNEFNKMAKGSTNSLQAMKAQKNALMGLRDQADIAGLEFKQLTADIAKLDLRMKKAGASATGFKGKLKGFAQGAGAVAAAGIFGGPEGLVGAGIGSLFGPSGAIAGGVIGAQVGMARKGFEEIAVYNAGLGRQKKALQLVIGDTEKYKKAQQFLAETSEKLAIPQDVITRQFTSLTASVVGAGHSVQDAQDVFLSITSGIRGTGGSIEDMNAALRATSQVFSKGKVSAEELRQQLGERLPGAFTLFAASMNKTPAELDKALEQGKVTLQDFMGFSKHLFEEYGENAAILAKAPEAAGDRLAVEIAKLKITFGGLFTNIGAAFQDNTTKVLKFLNENQAAIKLFIVDVANFADKTVKIFAVLMKAFGTFLKNIFTDVTNDLKSIFSFQIQLMNLTIRALNSFRKLMGRTAVETLDFAKDIQAILDADPRFTEENLFTTGTDFQALIDKINKQKEDAGGDGNSGDQTLNNLQIGAKAYFNTINDFAKQTQDAVAGAFKGMEDALVKFVMTGKLNFKDLARSIIADITRIFIRSQIISPLLGGFGNLFGGAGSSYKARLLEPVKGIKFEKGGIMANNKIVPYAKGGLIERPTIFPLGAGAALAGEAGPEAILPLQRGRGGKLGVIAQGGGTTNVVVNVDASGSSVEGDEQQGRELGRLISAAVQSEILQQQRPGGLLA